MSAPTPNPFSCASGSILIKFRATGFRRIDSTQRGTYAVEFGLVFLIFFLGAVVVALAIWVEIAYMPPMWVHAIIWPSVVLIAALGLLRPLKAIMVALEYKHKIGVGENES